ncbi:phage portal protein [Aeromonas caviae]
MNLEAFFDAITRNSSSGVVVNADSANSLASVFAAISFISRQVASYELTCPNAAVEYLLTVSPDDIMTANDFKLAAMQNLLQYGNAFARIHFGNDGWPEKLEFIASHRVSVNITPDHVLKNYWVDGKAELPSKLIHWKIHSLDGLIGRSPIHVCRDAIGLGIAQQNQAANQQANGLRPSGVIETELFLNSENGKKFKASLNERLPGETLVLEGGAQWKATSQSNADAEFTASRAFSVVEVARIFGLGKIWLNADEGGARYDNLGAEQRSLLLNTIGPYLNSCSE